MSHFQKHPPTLSMATIKKDLRDLCCILGYQDGVSISATGATSLQRAFAAHGEELRCRDTVEAICRLDYCLWTIARYSVKCKRESDVGGSDVLLSGHGGVGRKINKAARFSGLVNLHGDCRTFHFTTHNSITNAFKGYEVCFFGSSFLSPVFNRLQFLFGASAFDNVFFAFSPLR